MFLLCSSTELTILSQFLLYLLIAKMLLEYCTVILTLLFCRLGMQPWQEMQRHGQGSVFLSIIHLYTPKIYIHISHHSAKIFLLEITGHSV